MFPAISTGVHPGCEMTALGMRWQSLLPPVVIGIVLVVLMSLAGPGTFASPEQAAGVTADATVVTPADCTGSAAKETVQFTQGGQQRTGSLDACGHDNGDKVQISVPDGFGTGNSAVQLANVTQGHSGLLRPVALALFALSCLCGATYAFLMARKPRRTPALAA